MRRLAIFVWLVAMAACRAEQGTSLQLLDSPAPDVNCAFSADAQFFNPSGFYDPHGIEGSRPEAYYLSLRLVNNMITPVDDPAKLADRNVTPTANGVDIVGFNTCWDLASRHQSMGSADSGLPFKCSELPNAQRAYVASSGTVAAGGGKLAISVDVLSLEALQAPGIFGPDFFPGDIPEAAPAFVTAPQDFALPLADGACVQNATHACADTRNSNWGDFPHVADNQARVLVVLQAVGKSQDGTPMLSNWFVFPIDVCVGCAAGGCGFPSFTMCNATVVPNITSYTGPTIDLSKSCLPAQQGRPFVCKQLVCPTP